MTKQEVLDKIAQEEFKRKKDIREKKIKDKNIKK